MNAAVTLAATGEKGKLDVLHLKRFWHKNLLVRQGQLNGNAFTDEWPRDHALMNALGIGLEPTLKFLYSESPDFSRFEDWILEKNGGSLSAASVDTFNRLLSGNFAETENDRSAAVLSAADRAFFDENGYVIVRNAVSPEEAQAAAQAIWDFIGGRPDDPASWYHIVEGRSGIMLQLYHHPALEQTRRSERIRKVFGELWGHRRLFVSTDRTSFNPPENDHWKFYWPNLHWDTSVAQPIPFGLQGLLYLSDTAQNQGAFAVVPGFHRTIGEWLASLAPGADPRAAIVDHPGVFPIAANAGDAIIWHHALPHGSGPNMAALPRLVQYVTWMPVDAEKNPVWL